MGDLSPKECGDIEKDLWEMFGQSAAVLVTDMSHFSKVTQQHGIIYYLAMIKRMQDVVALSVAKHHGHIIKFIADNSFSIFNSVDAALSCILEINHKMKSENSKTPDIWDIEICSGVDHGKILNINFSDIFGDPVNVASKLGEDTASPWEVLVTERAKQLASNNFHFDQKITAEQSILIDAWHLID
jgi:class 3 adenylate cyclase